MFWTPPKKKFYLQPCPPAPQKTVRQPPLDYPYCYATGWWSLLRVLSIIKIIILLLNALGAGAIQIIAMVN
jgi:hypothetical protein